MNNKLPTPRRKNPVAIGLAILFFLPAFFLSQNYPLLKSSVRDYSDFSRVTIESSAPLSCSLEKSSSYLLVKMDANVRFRIHSEDFESSFIESLGWTKGRDYYILAIKTKLRNFSYDHFFLDGPPRLIIDVSLPGLTKAVRQDRANKAKTSQQDSIFHVSTSSRSKQRKQLSPPKGIKTIVIDPGHGGLETGAKGKFGTLEKNMTLAIGLKLKSIIERSLAFRVVMTREKDEDISLEDRAAKANNEKADIFLSIHTNSSYRKEARGSETFFLSLNATDEEARRLAYQENNPTEFEQGIVGENHSDIEMILWDMAQTSYMTQSSRLAERIQKELNVLLGTVNRGIKQAPFKVLTGVACPAALLEVVFISNPEEEQKLLTEKFQEDVAMAIYRGVLNYTKASSHR